MELSQALWVAGRAAESIEQARETIQLDPAWMGGWGALAWALFETGEYDEGLTAWVTYWRLRGGIDAQAAEAAYKAAVQFRETGEPQPLPAVDTPGLLVWAYVKAGQTNVAIEQLEELMRLLGPGRLAEFSAWWGLDDELGDDPRYQALIDQAGITW